MIRIFKLSPGEKLKLPSLNLGNTEAGEVYPVNIQVMQPDGTVFTTYLKIEVTDMVTERPEASNE